MQLEIAYNNYKQTWTLDTNYVAKPGVLSNIYTAKLLKVGNLGNITLKPQLNTYSTTSSNQAFALNIYVTDAVIYYNSSVASGTILQSSIKTTTSDLLYTGYLTLCKDRDSTSDLYQVSYKLTILNNMIVQVIK